MSTTSAWFQQLGYQIKYRSSTWFECLLQRDGERWLGVGIDREAAFADAVAKALPSEAARRAVEAAIAAASAPAAPPPPTPTPAAAPALGPQPTAAPTAPAAPPAAAMAPATAVPPPANVVVVPRSESKATEFIGPPAPPPEALDKAAASAELAALEQAIEENHVEASLLVPERQRMLLTQWMARGRAVQEASGGDREIEQRVYRIAQRLGTLSKVWWPGNVRVLASQAKPASCSEDVDGVPAAALRTWRDVERAAESAMERHEADAAKAGGDDFGWCDGGLLQPGPDEPATMLRAIVAVLERFTAPTIRRPQQALHASEYTPRQIADDLGPTSNWTDLAGRLRWLRGHVDDFELWGAALGRLRWLASRNDDVHMATYQVLLPSHRPAERWHASLGFLLRERRRRFDELTQQTPAADAADQAIVDWLLGLFALGNSIKAIELERATRPLRGRIAELPLAAFVERTGRRRLRRLRQDLGLPPLASEGSSAAEAVEPAEAPVEKDAAVAASPTPGLDALVAPLREHTSGKRVLVVSNRTDAARDELLRRQLGFAVVDTSGIEPSRVHGKERAVRQGSYDIVLAATGFLPHKVDGVLARACRTVGVPYVRINRGRIGQCLLHLARQFGLTARYGALDDAPALG
jgi:hypothetical protein